MKIFKSIVLFLLLGCSSAFAQNDAIDAAVSVVFETAGTKEYRPVQYAVFKTEQGKCGDGRTAGGSCPSAW